MRNVASGLREYYTQEGMTGRLVIVVCNLKPRTMKGFASEGMVLCAKQGEGVEFIDPPAGSKVGERVTCDPIPADAPWPVPGYKPCKGAQLLEQVRPPAEVQCTAGGLL